MDWQRFSNPTAIGRTWQSPEGERTVKQEGLRDGVLFYGVSTGNSPFQHLIRSTELENEIRIDESHYASRAAAKATRTATEERGKESARWFGFTDGMSAKAAGRANAVLSRSMTVRGQLGSRGCHIRRLVEEGFEVQNHHKFGRVLQRPDGSFFTEKDLTKIGLNFASYLRAR